MTAVRENLEEGLLRFGLREFRPGQRAVIETVLAQQDCLCIMPTGGGKSLCYQLPAVLRPGVTLVVSPLIALMKDQVDSLRAHGVAATFINSVLTLSEQRQRLEQMAAGAFDLVYIAPERLRNPRFMEALRGTKVELLAVDEAHCISEWGHDFRPDYARLGQFRERLGFPPTIALTATATPDVRSDIEKQLRLKDAEVFITGFARTNLRFEVFESAGGREKNNSLLRVLAETPGAGIVYASTRKKCEEVMEFLQQETKRKVGLYHAGLTPEQRRQVQDRFMGGEVDVIVATNAFGMGIDKAELRFVVHYNMPGTLEAYYQEAGRAGRDGKSSRCAMLFSFSDRYVQEFFIDMRYPARDTVRQVYSYLCSLKEDPIEITLQELKDRLGLSTGAEGIGACEQLLEKCGAIDRLASQNNMASVKLDSDLPTMLDLLPRDAKRQRKVLRVIEREVGERRFEWVFFQPQQLAAKADLDRDAFNRALRELMKLDSIDYVPPFRGRAIRMLTRETPFDKLDIDFAELERRKQAEVAKLERVITYATSRRCRQLEILDYFGDPDRKECGSCDHCSPNGLAEFIDGHAKEQDEIGEGTLEAVRISLSGAARTNGRIGKLLLAKMLGGSAAAQVKKLQLHRLSTFGLLRDLTQTEIADLLDAMIACGLLKQKETFNKAKKQKKFRTPTVNITALGTEVMLGQRGPDGLRLAPELVRRLDARLRSPKSLVAQPALEQSSPDSISPREPQREEPSRQHPPEEMPAPKSVAASAKIAQSTNDAAPFIPKPTHFWTWRLFADGFTFDECLAVRRLDEETVISHLARSVDEGLSVQPNWFLTNEQLMLVEPLAELAPSDRLRAIVAELPDSIRYEHVALYLKCITATGNEASPAYRSES
ncbi:MAG: RecQ family ATP-dependent DNA helicase [Planctomycetaceae bacterium]|nr:RecQ family ATP-dependent DNA helicase [Planctomycetales bacterium]MCB9923484.1 RecQ family ATP-dependent DNA helicase [Planctomycetaceae bacterium]